MASNQLLDLPLLGLENEFPDRLYVLFHPPTGKYGCCCHEEVHGLASFSDENFAERFADMIKLAEMKILELSFDEAREVAKGRPLPVVALFLMDDMKKPLIHYVR